MSLRRTHRSLFEIMAVSVTLWIFVALHVFRFFSVTGSYEILPNCGDESEATKCEDCRHYVRYTFKKDPELVSASKWKYKEEATCLVCSRPCCVTRGLDDPTAEDTDCGENFEGMGFYRKRNVWVKENGNVLTYVVKQKSVPVQKKVYLPLPSKEKCYFVIRNAKFNGEHCTSRRFVRDVFDSFPSRCRPGETYHSNFQSCVNNTRNSNYRSNQ